MLSFCAIVKNEEKNLPRCLSSIQSVVDEIIILDTGSTDATVEIAKSFGAKIYHYQWSNDFSAARNFALQYVTGDWILVLDADEEFVPSLIPKIQELMADEQTLVINLIRQEVGAAQSPYSLVSRLFRNHPKVKFTRPYHSIVDDTAAELLKQEPNWKIAAISDVAILHYGYQTEAINALNKYDRAQVAMERFLAENPEDAYDCSKLGALYIERGEIDKGIELLKRGLANSDLDVFTRYELHYHLGNAQRNLNQIFAASEHYQIALQQPILPILKLGAFNNLGSLCMAVGDFTNAQKLYQTTVEIDPKFAQGWYNLGMAQKGLGEFALAIASYQTALSLNPEAAEVHQNLGVIYLKLGRIAESLAAFKQAISLHQKTNPSEAQRLQQGLEEMGFTVES